MQGQENNGTFWWHLEAMRRMILRIIAVYAVIATACFAVMPYIFDTVILAPVSNDFPVYRLLSSLKADGFICPGFSGGCNVEIINASVTSQFMTHISTSLSVGLLLLFPYMIGEIWAFVRPALYPEERRSAIMLMLLGVPMFYIGCALGYFVVFPFTFRFLAQYEISAYIANTITLDSYINTFLMLVMVMGIVFELPFAMWIMSKTGIISSELMRHYRRHAVVALLVLAAVITPTGDPFTLLLVFMPLYLLYEFSILVTPADKRNINQSQ